VLVIVGVIVGVNVGGTVGVLVKMIEGVMVGGLVGVTVGSGFSDQLISQESMGPRISLLIAFVSPQ